MAYETIKGRRFWLFINKLQQGEKRGEGQHLGQAQHTHTHRLISFATHLPQMSEIIIMGNTKHFIWQHKRVYPLSTTPLPPSRSSYSAQQLVRCPAPSYVSACRAPTDLESSKGLPKTFLCVDFISRRLLVIALASPFSSSSPPPSSLPILMLVPLFLVVLLPLLPLLSLGHFSEKCFQLLRVGSACAHLPPPPSLSPFLSLSCLGSVHIKYVFPISVYLVFHFLFYVCQISNGATAATTIKHSSRRERPQKVTTTVNCSHSKCHRSAASRKRGR